MDFARQQRDPTKHMIGVAFVVLMHLFVIYALMTGLGRTMMQIVKKPLSAKIIEELKLPPPPPPKKIELPRPPPPKVETFVPPPDVPVVSAPTGPTITVVTPKPPEPKVEQPVVAAPRPPPPPPKPAIRRDIKPISREEPVYPRSAIRMGIDKGRVIAHVMIDEKGNVTGVVIVSAEPPRHFDKAVIDALSQWKYTAEGEKYVVEIEISFSLKD